MASKLGEKAEEGCGKGGKGPWHGSIKFMTLTGGQARQSQKTKCVGVSNVS